MQILGFEPVIITIAVCVIGVSYRIVTGMIGKSWREFNPTLAMTTFMLGIVTSIGLVAPVIDALPNDMDTTLQLAAVVGQIGLVMGMDAAVRKGQKTAQALKEKRSKNIVESELTPIDDPSDLPPGKGTDTTEKSKL